MDGMKEEIRGLRHQRDLIRTFSANGSARTYKKIFKNTRSHEYQKQNRQGRIGSGRKMELPVSGHHFFSPSHHFFLTELATHSYVLSLILIPERETRKRRKTEKEIERGREREKCNAAA